MLVGMLLLQAAWILVVPPFRGMDEHEHAYKAAAVAGGDWSPHHRASPGGWGEMVVVPRTLVVAAHPICAALPYTNADNCSAVDELDHGLVTVASSAARYNPAFYFVIGTAARPFEGAHALYAMRAATALLCAVLIALAALVTSSWARTRWPFVALLLATTPVMVYSTAIAAPNGVELAAAMLVWTSLLGLVQIPSGSPHTRRFIAAATVGAVPLSTVRSLGPLWLLLIVSTVALLFRHRHLVRLVKRKDSIVSILTVAIATALALAWTVTASTNDSGGVSGSFPGSAWKVLPENLVLWLFQSIAAFPARDELAPLWLYCVALLAWWLFLAIAWRVAGWRERWVLLLVVAIASAVPVVATVATFRQLGTIWQGRYGYPFAMGFILICGLAIDRSVGRSSPAPRWLLPVAGLSMFTIEIVGQLFVLANQMRDSPLAHDPAWVRPAPILVIVLTGLGTLVITSAGLVATNTAARDPRGAGPRAARSLETDTLAR